MCPGLGGRKLEGKDPRDPGESLLKAPAGHSGLQLVGGKLHPFGECLHRCADRGGVGVGVA